MRKWLLLVALCDCSASEKFEGTLTYLGDACGVPGVTFDREFCFMHRNDAGKQVSARGERVKCDALFNKGICAHVSAATITAPTRPAIGITKPAPTPPPTPALAQHPLAAPSQPGAPSAGAAPTNMPPRPQLFRPAPATRPKLLKR